MHVISLGYFCSVAEELEKMGLRSESSPFDWVLSEFPGVIRAIHNRFEGFLEYEDLCQSVQNHSVYQSMQYGIVYVHDFSPYQSLQKQLPAVRQKYYRRIERFYQSISEPTIFIRYISDERKKEGISEELLWIEENYEEIVRTIKQFHGDNEIIFIANNGVESEIITIYNVAKGENDTVSRNPLHDNSDLFARMLCLDFPNRESNIRRYQKKVRKNRSFANRAKNRVAVKYRETFLKEYIHEKQY